MKLYNTLTRKKQEFKPLNANQVKIYLCGPTVYWYPHIGNLRTYVNNDILIRALNYLGFKTKVVMNITDVGHLTGDRDIGEDKMEKAAREKKLDIWQLAKKYTDYFWQASAKLNIKKPDIVCKATDYIPSMISLVKKLEEKGYTYKTDDGVYFDTSKVKDYGSWFHLNLKGLQDGARVEKNSQKKNPADFALWKFAKPGEKRQMEWISPWGPHSFPGWHIECSAMAMHHLGNTLDIHAGGIEHIPVHHTNEIAQSQAVTGKQFVRYWFHSSHLLVDNQKMSKSLKNIYTLDQLEEKHFDPLDLRYFYLTAHYKSKLNFTWKALTGAQVSLNKLRETITGLSNQAKTGSDKQLKKDWQKQFLQAINDDLNMPQALSLVWQLIKSSLLASQDKLDLLQSWDQVFGLDLFKKTEKTKIPEKIKKLVKLRQKLRQEKKWQKADQLRQKIEDKGFIIEDSNRGIKIKVKKNVG